MGRTLKRLAIAGVSVCVAVLVAYAVFWVATRNGLAILAGSAYSNPLRGGIYLLAQVAAPVAAGVLSAFGLRRRWFGVSERRPVGLSARVSLGILAIGYVLTATVGAPMAQSDLTDMAMTQARSEQALRVALGSNHRWTPYQRTLGAIPVAPGIIAVYHEYQAGPSNGRGAIYGCVWYVAGVKCAPFLQLWVS
jgi:hypothetical protein